MTWKNLGDVIIRVDETLICHTLDAAISAERADRDVGEILSLLIRGRHTWPQL